MSLKYIVKSVTSGDSLVLRDRPGPQGQPPKERILHLADIVSPKAKTPTTDEEDWAFESREFLRSLTVGKEITFTSTHSLSSSADNTRDIGTAEINGLDVSIEILKHGWAKLKELKREPTEEDLKKREAETEAKNSGKGVWNPHGPQARTVEYNMPADSQAFMTTWKGKPIDAVVEHVRDGSTVRVRLFLSETEHQFVTVAMAGVRTPRLSTKQGEPSEQWAEEAKFFTESRLLQRHVRVTLLSLPQSTATPFQAGSSGAPPPAMTLIGNVIHPVGNIADHLVAAGYARVVDWHAGMLASSGGMDRLRAAEKVAKEKRLYLYANLPTSSTASKASGYSGGGSSKNFDGTVIRVWSGDQLSVVDKDGRERRVQLSSTRAPKQSDPKQAYHANEAREFLRKKLIGKHVKVTIDFIRPREGEFDERECATVRYASHNTNIAEQLIDKGLASVVRHKRDDEDRSPDFDKLVAAEQAAVNEQRGIHSQKEIQPPKPPSNISESSHRATSFVNSFKRQGKIPAVVDYVAAGSRFKIFLPKDNQVLTLVLGGIRAPRTARNASEKGEPYGTEAAEFATRRYMQRDVEIEIETVDKSGGFIGALWLNKNENAAVALVQEGLATVHSYSADTLSWSKQLYAAEAEAKSKKLNIWKDYDEEAEKEVQPVEEDPAALKTKYLDIVVSDVRTTNGLGFSVQILGTEEIASFEQLMKEFSLHHKTAGPAPAGFAPRTGELVSAKFSDGQWYRAKVRKSSTVKKEAQVTFIDYGNQDTIGFKDIKPLEQKFKSLPGQAHEARMSFVKLVAPESEYFTEAVDRFRQLCEGRKLVANIDHKEGGLLHLRLIDPANPDVAEDPNACINVDLVVEGLASIDRKGSKYLNAYPGVYKKLRGAVTEAKRQRSGMFEFGDVEEDE